MKKLFPTAIIAVLGVLTLAPSCTKKSDPTGNYTCTCIITTAGVTDTVKAPFTGVTNGTASADCGKLQTTYTSAGASSASCHL